LISERDQDQRRPELLHCPKQSRFEKPFRFPEHQIGKFVHKVLNHAGRIGTHDLGRKKFHGTTQVPKRIYNVPLESIRKYVRTNYQHARRNARGARLHG
jgi:hypothetical protein